RSWLNSLKHPHLLTVYGGGAWDDFAFVAAEWPEGAKSLHQWGTRCVPPEDAARTGETLARTIAAVHGLGVIHGNLEPHNVLVTPDGTLKVAEVGLANQPPEHSDVELTPSFARDYERRDPVGNFDYLAPEVFLDMSKVGP